MNWPLSLMYPKWRVYYNGMDTYEVQIKTSPRKKWSRSGGISGSLEMAEALMERMIVMYYLCLRNERQVVKTKGAKVRVSKRLSKAIVISAELSDDDEDMAVDKLKMCEDQNHGSLLGLLNEAEVEGYRHKPFDSSRMPSMVLPKRGDVDHETGMEKQVASIVEEGL